jgi:hypothetical protein
MGLEKNSHVVRVGGEAVGGFHFCLVSEGRKKAFPFGTLRRVHRALALARIGRRGGVARWVGPRRCPHVRVFLCSRVVIARVGRGEWADGLDCSV